MSVFPEANSEDRNASVVGRVAFLSAPIHSPTFSPIVLRIGNPLCYPAVTKIAEIISAYVLNPDAEVPRPSPEPVISRYLKMINSAAELLICILILFTNARRKSTSLGSEIRPPRRTCLKPAYILLWL